MTETDRPDPFVDPPATDTERTGTNTDRTATNTERTATSVSSQPILADEPTVETVVTAVASETDRDPAAIRRDIDPFTDGGILTDDAITATVSDVSQIVATAETRVDLAAQAVDDVRMVADPVIDLDVVHTRVRTLERRLATLQRRTAELGDAVSLSADRRGSPVDLHRSAVTLRETAADAQRVVRVADDLTSDVETFETWITSPAKRTETFSADIDALDEAIEDLSTVVDRVVDRVVGSTATISDEVEGQPILEGAETPAEMWFNATVQTRVFELLVADLRAEGADLQRWADREDVSIPALLLLRIDAADRRLATLSATLADVVASDVAASDAAASDTVASDAADWQDQFADRLAATERRLDRFDPPVAWDRVQDALADSAAHP